MVHKEMEEIDQLTQMLNDQSTSLGDLIDKCSDQQSGPTTKSFRESIFQKQDEKVLEFGKQLEKRENEIASIKRKWIRYLVDNDKVKQLNEELGTLISRAQNESTNYRILLNQVENQIKNLKVVLHLMTGTNDEQLEGQTTPQLDENQTAVAREFEQKREILMKCLSKVQENSIEHSQLTKKFHSAVEQMKELSKAFSELKANSLTEIQYEKLEAIDDQAQKFLDMNRSLGSEILTLQRSLNERREKLLDLDIIENLAIKRAQFDGVYNEAANLEEAIEQMINALELKLMATFDDETQQLLETLIEELNDMNNEIKLKFDELDALSHELKEVEDKVRSEDADGQLKSAEITTLMPYLLSIGNLGTKITSLKTHLEKMEQELSIKKLEMGDTDVNKKLQNHEQITKQYIDESNVINNEIQTMKNLINELEEYASDQEETANIQDMKKQLDTLSENTQDFTTQCTQVNSDIHLLSVHFKSTQAKLTPETLDDLAQLDQVVQMNEKTLESLNEKLDRCMNRFNDFDLHSKCAKRVKQVEEGRMLSNKIKNRANKLLRKVREKSDEQLEEADAQELETIERDADEYKAKYENLLTTQQELQRKLDEDIQKKIPKDALTISVEDQLDLLKAMKTIKEELTENNRELAELREHFHQLQDKLTALNFRTQQGCEFENYLPDHDDHMDNLLSDFLNTPSNENPIIQNHKLQVEFKRLGPGQYQYGTKKILTKVVNGKLMVRVGGGMMTMEEFVESYGEKELKKQMHREYEDLNSVNSFTQDPQRKKTNVGNHQKNKNSNGGVLSEDLLKQFDKTNSEVPSHF